MWITLGKSRTKYLVVENGDFLALSTFTETKNIRQKADVSMLSSVLVTNVQRAFVGKIVPCFPLMSEVKCLLFCGKLHFVWSFGNN